MSGIAAFVVVIVASVDAAGAIGAVAIVACCLLETEIVAAEKLVVPKVASVTSEPAAAMPSLSRPVLAIGHPFGPTQMGYRTARSILMAHESDIAVAERLCFSQTTLSTFPG